LVSITVRCIALDRLALRWIAVAPFGLGFTRFGIGLVVG